MKTNMLKQYLEPFKDPDHLPHVKNLRIGTRALTFWPQRFTTDPDADSLIELLRDVKEIGGRHIAIMSHLSHYRELSTKKVQDAIHRLKQDHSLLSTLPEWSRSITHQMDRASASRTPTPFPRRTS